MKVREYPCKQGASQMTHQFKTWKQSRTWRCGKEKPSTLQVGKGSSITKFEQGSSTKKVGNRFINHEGWKQKSSTPRVGKKNSTTMMVGNKGHQP